jgi:hypothetical protein
MYSGTPLGRSRANSSDSAQSMAVRILLPLALLLQLADASCPSKCSGHGTCQSSNT